MLDWCKLHYPARNINWLWLRNWSRLYSERKLSEQLVNPSKEGYRNTRYLLEGTYSPKRRVVGKRLRGDRFQLSHNSKYVSVYVRNSNRGPADYYRVIQYLPHIGMPYIVHNAVTERSFDKNISMSPGIRRKLFQGWLWLGIYGRRLKSIIGDLRKKPSLIIVQKEVFPRVMGPFAGWLLHKLCSNRALVWDFDDDIFLSKAIGARERKLLENDSDLIIVTSDYLESLLGDELHEKVVKLPTTDGFCNRFDYHAVTISRLNTYENEIRLVWVGTQANLDNVDLVIPYLEEASRTLMAKHKKHVTLTIVCNARLQASTSYLEISNVKWEREVAEEAIANAHIGIMPLKDTMMSLGKGGFKLIQYISLGLPVIASNVGFNKKIVEGDMGRLISWDSVDAWADEVVELSTNQELWLNSSHAAKERYDSSFSIDKNIDTWKELIRELAAR